jgi:hypothetical protein
MSEAAIDLLASCFESDPAYRPSDAGVVERLLAVVVLPEVEAAPPALRDAKQLQAPPPKLPPQAAALGKKQLAKQPSAVAHKRANRAFEEPLAVVVLPEVEAAALGKKQFNPGDAESSDKERLPKATKVQLGMRATIAVLVAFYLANTTGALWWWRADAKAIFFPLLATVAQAVLIFGAGTKDLVKPMGRKRFWIPLIIAGAMFAFLLWGLKMAVSELLETRNDSVMGFFTMGFFTVLWLFWLIAFGLLSIRWTRIAFFRNLTANLLSGSLLELLISIPSHIVVSRRPGCFQGLGTAFGIFSGIYVALFAFGPGAIWLMIRKAGHDLERKKARIKRFEEKFRREQAE